MRYRPATVEDASLLAELNQQLIQDEGHREIMTLPELKQRMRTWLATEYEATIFEDDTGVLAYALYRNQEEQVYLRQFFVVRRQRRKGIGRTAMNVLRTHIWSSNKRLVVDVLMHNKLAIRFWKAVGFQEYCLTLEILPTE